MSLAKLKQGSNSVQKYASQFDRIMVHIPRMTETEKYQRFFDGLKDNIRSEIRRRRTKDDKRFYVTLKAMATEAETIIEESCSDGSKKQSFGDHNRRRASFTEKTQKLAKKLLTIKKDVKCFHCRKTGHYSRDCWTRKNSESATNSSSSTSSLSVKGTPTTVL
jgi:hypothetical protein